MIKGSRHKLTAGLQRAVSGASEPIRIPTTLPTEPSPELLARFVSVVADLAALCDETKETNDDEQ